MEILSSNDSEYLVSCLDCNFVLAVAHDHDDDYESTELALEESLLEKIRVEDIGLSSMLPGQRAFKNKNAL